MTQLNAREQGASIRPKDRFLPVQSGMEPDPTLSARGIIATSLCMGLATGFIELGILVVRNEFSGGISLGSLQMNRHYEWMIPLADLSLFLAVGLVLAIASKIAPRRVTPIVAPTFTFLAALSLILMIPGLYQSSAIVLAAGIAVAAKRWGLQHRINWAGLRRRSLPVLCAGLVGAMIWDLGDEALARPNNAKTVSATAGARQKPNVLLIVLDTVRAESLDLYGYSRKTSPNLIRLAERGIRFDQARSTAPWTLPSHASIFTGQWPHELGVGEDRPLGRSYPTIAEYLSSQGYETAGFIANTYFCNSWYGLGRGFETYVDYYDEDVVISASEVMQCSALGKSILKAAGQSVGVGRNRKSAEGINRDFLSWLDTKPRDDPFFVFLNYFDAHTPFVVPDNTRPHFGLSPMNPQDLDILTQWESRPKHNVSDHEITLIRDSYDDCIAYLDEHLGKLFDSLEERDVLKDTLVIVTADHGEQLGEHGLYGHGRSLYSQELRVPLLIVPPGGLSEAKVVTTPVSLRDLPTTIVDLVGAEAPTPFPGGSLASLWQGSRSAGESPISEVVGEVSLRKLISKNPNRAPAWRGPMSSLVAEGASLIRNADGRKELYDVEKDLSEFHDLAEQSEWAETRDRLGKVLDQVSPPPPASKH